MYLYFTTWSLVMDQVHEVLAEFCITKIVLNKPDNFQMFGESVIHVCSIPVLKMLVIHFTTTQVSPSEIGIVWLMPLLVLEACRTQRTKPDNNSTCLQSLKYVADWCTKTLPAYSEKWLSQTMTATNIWKYSQRKEISLFIFSPVRFSMYFCLLIFLTIYFRLNLSWNSGLTDRYPTNLLHKYTHTHTHKHVCMLALCHPSFFWSLLEKDESLCCSCPIIQLHF